jgi:hypothetical protein
MGPADPAVSVRLAARLPDLGLLPNEGSTVVLAILPVDLVDVLFVFVAITDASGEIAPNSLNNSKKEKAAFTIKAAIPTRNRN